MSVAPAPAPERPLPTPTRESQPYWDGMREGKFMLQHCAACGKVRHYPRPVCPHCFSTECTFKEAAQGGAIHSWTVCHHPFNFFFNLINTHITFFKIFRGTLGNIFLTVTQRRNISINPFINKFRRPAFPLHGAE